MDVVERTLNDWLDGFAYLYGVPDSRRQPEHFWIGAMAHFSSVGEAIRQYEFLNIYKTSAHAICWLLCFANKIRRTEDLLFRVDEPIWRLAGFKFPMKCGHCMQDSCNCSTYEREGAKSKEFRYEQWLSELDKVEVNLKERSISGWMAMYCKIFGKKMELRPLDSIGFKLLEEGGETAKAIRSLTQFRGVIDDAELKIDKAFLEEISNLKGMVHTHKILTDQLKEHYNLEHAKDVRKKVKSHVRDSTLIKWRIVDCKLNLVSEYCDSFSWLCSLLDKCNHIHGKLELTADTDIDKWNIEKILTTIYHSNSVYEKMKCYSCIKENCECLIFSPIQPSSSAS
jgi:hypothetical protein